MVLLTVTGPPGSGKSTACRTIKERTGLPYIYAGQIFRDQASGQGLTLDEFGSLCEKYPNFDVELDNRMLELAKKGNAILEGRMIGALCLRERIPAYKVYIDADIDMRAARVMEREGGDMASVRHDIEGRERSERSRYMDLYGIDPRDRMIYDLWVDSTYLTPDEVVELILKGAGI
ncbi:MAG: (d)CMP kinase [Candidatus Thermoplasmatota archaeon]|jgi:cytidylate kinase/H/ACA ribonucleoprotein complex subunit 4|nr:(d)CMP kinase [Candidatus Thermoplasmatota archaeon]